MIVKAITWRSQECVICFTVGHEYTSFLNKLYSNMPVLPAANYSQLHIMAWNE